MSIRIELVEMTCIRRVAGGSTARARVVHCQDLKQPVACGKTRDDRGFNIPRFVNNLPGPRRPAGGLVGGGLDDRQPRAPWPGWRSGGGSGGNGSGLGGGRVVRVQGDDLCRWPVQKLIPADHDRQPLLNHAPAPVCRLNLIRVDV